MKMLSRYANMYYKYKLTLVFSIFIITATFLITAVNNYISEYTIREEVIKYSKITTDQIIGKTDIYITELSKLAEMINNEIIINGMDNYQREQSAVNEYKTYWLIKDTFVNYYNTIKDIKNIKNIFLYTANGHLFYQENYEDQMLVEDLSGNAWYRNFLRSPEMVRVSVTQGFPFRVKKSSKHLFLFRKIYNFKGKYFGVIGLIAQIDKLGKVFGNSDAQYKANIILFDQNGTIIYRQDNQFKTAAVKYIIQTINHRAGGLKSLKIDAQKFLVVYQKSALTGWTTTFIISEAELFKKIYWARSVALFFLMALEILFIAVIFGISSLMSKNIMRLAAAMKKVEKGDLTVRVKASFDDEIGVLGKGFNTMVSRISGLIDNLVMVRTSKKEAELRALISQINPHFLFNTLETIRMRSIVLEEYGTAELIENLSNLFRMSTNWKDDFISIRQELEYLKSYLAILNLRYNNRFELNLETDEAICEAKIPKLILQPLVENSINHGFEGFVERAVIVVSLRKEDDFIRIGVADNGSGIAVEKLVEINESLQNEVAGARSTDMAGSATDYGWGGIGLKNVNDRLRHYFGDNSGLTITSASGEGTTISFQIPRTKAVNGNV